MDEPVAGLDPPAASTRGRQVGVGLLVVVAVVALAAGGIGGWLLGRSSRPAQPEIAAEQFCALGDEDGASLLDVAGWTKAAQRTNEDWQQVLNEIESRCPSWRDQIVAKSDSLDD